MSTLLLIPQAFAIGMIGQQNGDSIFNYNVTTDWRYVCDPSEQTLFPNNFATLTATGWVATLVTLSASDFPQPTTPP